VSEPLLLGGTGYLVFTRGWLLVDPDIGAYLATSGLAFWVGAGVVEAVRSGRRWLAARRVPIGARQY